MEKLTEQQKSEYVERPFYCPYCGHVDIYTGKMEIPEGRETTQGVGCRLCGRTWRDVYRVVRIEEVEEG